MQHIRHILLVLALLSLFDKSLAQNIDTVDIQNQVDSLIQVNRKHVSEQQFEQALHTIVLAESLTQNKLPSLYAQCLYNHGRTYYYAGQNQEAIPLFQQALDIQKTDPGQKTADYAYSLTGLANASRELGLYETAEPLYEESKTIRGQVFGSEHPIYAGAITNLGILNWEMGNFEKAENLLLQCLAIRKNELSSADPEYADALSNLGILYIDMGQYKKAENHIQECISIQESILGTDHPSYANSLNLLGIIFFNKGDFEKVESLYKESIRIYEKSYGKHHQNLIGFLSNLADYYTEVKDHEKAEELYSEILNILKQNSSESSSEFAIALNNLADLNRINRQYAKAASLYEQSRKITEEALGTEHPNYSLILEGLADVFEIQRKTAHSDEILKEVSLLKKKRLDDAMSFLSEKELSAYSKLFENDLGKMLNYLKHRHSLNLPREELNKLTYDNILFYKGYLLTAVRQIKSLTSSNPLAYEINNKLKGVRRMLAREYTYPLAERDSSVIHDLEEEATMFEKQMAKYVSGYSAANQEVDWKLVQSKLGPAEAALEFIHFPCEFPNATDSILYAVLLIKKDIDAPIFIPLFEEKQLKNLFQSSRKLSGDEVSIAIYKRGLSPVERQIERGLYELLWEPFQHELDNIKTIYYSPSGQLHRISFEAIINKEKQYLSDVYQLARLGSTRTLTVQKAENSTPEKHVLLIGGIDYDLDSTQIHAKKIIDVSSDKSAPFVLSHMERGEDQRESHWTYLPGTKKEITSIAGMLQENGHSALVFTGQEATEASFKTLTNSDQLIQIIHIATHGFFYPDPDHHRAQRKSSSQTSELSFKMSDHPMIRSGLLMAGANHTWTTGSSRGSGQEDGILTAYEISQLDLNDTELVVLSACETGLGDIEGNEGVYGLQRAFNIAGAQYLIMSLWSVPDQQTAQLMNVFYTYWMTEEYNIPEAFRAAQKDLRDEGLDPYSWAGFVLVE